MGRAILQLHLSVLKDVLMLPEGYKLVKAEQDNKHGFLTEVVNFTVESDEVPLFPDGKFPEMYLECKVESHPDDHEFKRITITPKLRGSCDLYLNFPVDEWMSIKQACEDLEGKKLKNSEIINMVKSYCKDKMKDFAVKMEGEANAGNTSSN